MPPIASRASKIAYVLCGRRLLQVMRGADPGQARADDQDIDVLTGHCTPVCALACSSTAIRASGAPQSSSEAGAARL